MDAKAFSIHMLEERINLAARMLGKARTQEEKERCLDKIRSLEEERARLIEEDTTTCY